MSTTAEPYVKLSCGVLDDADFRTLPHAAQLLFLLLLPLARRQRTGGTVPADPVRVAWLLREPDTVAVADSLGTLQSGGWLQPAGDGELAIVRWHDYQDTIRGEGDRPTPSDAGRSGAHLRHHINGGKPSPDCRLCAEQGLVADHEPDGEPAAAAPAPAEAVAAPAAPADPEPDTDTAPDGDNRPTTSREVLDRLNERMGVIPDGTDAEVVAAYRHVYTEVAPRAAADYGHISGITEQVLLNAVACHAARRFVDEPADPGERTGFYNRVRKMRREYGADAIDAIAHASGWADKPLAAANSRLRKGRGKVAA